MAYKKICGIYKITSPNGRVYIGQSLNIYKRWADYRCLNNCNEQHKLFNSFLKYGVKNHVFEIICECSSLKECNEKEIYYGKLFNVTDKHNGLNIRECGGSRGKHSPETKEKLRIINTGKKLPKRQRILISISQLGRKTWNKGLKGVQVAWNKGLPMKDETKEKLRIINTGKKLTEEQKNKISISLKGRIKTEEHLRNISKALKGKKFSEEIRKKLSESHKGIKQTIESRKKRSESLKKFYKTKK